MKRLLLVISMATMTVVAGAQIKYPLAEKDGTQDEYFGTKVSDPYRWLEDENSAATKAWVEAENAVTSKYFSKIKFRDRMLKRLNEVSDYEKLSAPFKRAGKIFFYKNSGLQNQSVLYVKDSENAEPRVFLDPNALSEDGTVALNGIYFSNDEKYMAYSISRSGSDWREFYVMETATGKLLPDHIEWAKFSGASWRGDGFYYSAYDAPTGGREFTNVNEGHKVYYHKIGTPQSEDRLFFQNPMYPQRFYIVDVSEDEKIMYLYEDGMGTGNLLYVKDLTSPDSQFMQMVSDYSYNYSPIAEQGSTIYILTNFGAPKYRIMAADLSRPGIRNWKEVLPEQENVIEGIAPVADKLIISFMKDACTHSYIYDYEGNRLSEIKLPSVGSAGFSCRKGHPECYYTFTSFTVPSTIYSYDIESGASTLYDSPKVNFDPNAYESVQVFFPSKDGTSIPMFLTYRKGLKLNGKNPVYLYGYGGFNIALNPGFSATRIPFLEKGGIYAQVNLRGGSEYGEEWHLAGTKLNKQNVFDDFIGAAEWLIANKYTDTQHLAIVGGSNGGLLVGACMTQRPDLFGVAIPQVGVMDMLRYHKFTIGWNWAGDYGTSEDSPEMFNYLLGYSPLHNLRPGTKYPATLVTTADHDDRVVPAHSFKFAATLQECQAGDAPCLIRIDTKAGHGGGKPMSKRLEEQADIYSFILYNMGIKY